MGNLLRSTVVYTENNMGMGYNTLDFRKDSWLYAGELSGSGTMFYCY